MTTSGATPSGEWKNCWREIYEEEFGAEETEKRLKTQFQFPEAGLFSWLGLLMESTKLKLIFSLVARRTGKRGTHPYGVGGTGSAAVVENLEIPENDFFTPGRKFQVTLRHSNFRNDDDAIMGGRSVSIKFNDVADGSVQLDLLMNTGKINFFQNIPTFLYFLNLARETDEEVIKTAVYDRPINLQATIEYLRRAPSSYTHLHYYALTTYLLQTKSGDKRHVRFRIIPHDVINMAESGLPTREEQKTPLKYERLESETRPKNYLREAFKQELGQRELKYHVEIQVHDQLFTDNSDHELFNSSVEWDPAQYPWRRLVEVTLTTPVSDEEIERTNFTLVNRPPCLTIPDPKSKYDYNSLPYAREKVYPYSQYLRQD